jgi:hypothetical protein
MYTSFGMDKTKKTEGSRQSQSYNTRNYYWNEHIRSEVNAYDNFNYDQPKAEELLKGICSRASRRHERVHWFTNNSDKTNRLLLKFLITLVFREVLLKPSVS